MRKIKKIVFMIIFCLICISFHNVSFAAETWKKKGGVELKSKTCTVHNNCTVYEFEVLNKEVHIGKNGFKDGSDIPVLGDGSKTGDELMICFQHDGRSGSENNIMLKGIKKLEIQYQIKVDGKHVTVIPVSAAAKKSAR